MKSALVLLKFCSNYCGMDIESKFRNVQLPIEVYALPTATPNPPPPRPQFAHLLVEPYLAPAL